MSVFRYRAWANDGPPLKRQCRTCSQRRAYLRETALDKDANPRIRALRRDKLRRESYPVDMASLVRAVLAIRYAREPLPLHLESSALSDSSNSIDDFLVSMDRPGFCVLTMRVPFVYLLRAAGIPARMVGGYQGGELNSHYRPSDGAPVRRSRLGRGLAR